MTDFLNWSSCSLWGIVASLVLVGTMYSAQEAGWSRMSIPFLLGSAWTMNRRRAKVLGVGAHIINGLVFAVLYCWGFEELGRATWWMGGAAGVLHTGIVLTVVMPVLPFIHPNMATSRSGPEPTRWLQPPGFLALNYGRRTPVVALAAHVAYGVILGAFYTLA